MNVKLVLRGRQMGSPNRPNKNMNMISNSKPVLTSKRVFGCVA